MMKLLVRCALVVACAAQSMFALFDLSVVNTKNVLNCNSGDNVTTVEGQYNQVQIVRGCDRISGSTGGAVVLAPEELPRLYSSVTTTKGVNDITISFPQQTKTFGYNVNKKVRDVFTGKEVMGTTTLLLAFTDDLNGMAQLTTYTSAPWAGQVPDTWTRRVVVPFNVAIKELAGTPILLQFNADGKVTIAIGDPQGDRLQETINLFDPRAV
jgi:hypothetical protein